jgi:FkbM family methyltransferase
VLLRPLRDKPPLVFDLGANRGDFSRSLAAEFGGEFRLVEANPDLVAEIRANTSFTVVHAAVGATHQTVVFNIAANDEGSSVLDLPENSAYNSVRTGTIEVEQIPLEDFLLGEGRPVDLLKLDIEGAEVAALGGLTSATLESVAQITVEFHCDPSFGFGGADAVARFLSRCRRSGFFILDFSAPRKMDVLLLNRAILTPSRPELLLWYLMPGLIWARERRARLHAWRRTTLGIRPRDALRHRRGSHS